MSQFGWHVNIDNCIGCRACEAACKQEFNLPVGVRRRRVLVDEGDVGGVPYRRHITMSCNHCAEPGCLKACPVNRYWKDADPVAYPQPGTDVAAQRAYAGITGPYTGLVLIKPSVAENPVLGVDCTGCKRCMAACPYGAPQWNAEAGVIDKCTGCHHRQFPAAGTTLPVARQKPACVVTCTSLALAWGDMATVNTWANRRAGDPVATTTWNGAAPADGKEITNPSYTTPSVRFTPQSNIV